MPPKRSKRRMDENGEDETAKRALQVHSTVYDVFSYPAVDLSTEDSEDVAHNPIQSGTNPILFEVDGNSRLYQSSQHLSGIPGAGAR